MRFWRQWIKSIATKPQQSTAQQSTPCASLLWSTAFANWNRAQWLTTHKTGIIVHRMHKSHKKKLISLHALLIHTWSIGAALKAPFHISSYPLPNTQNSIFMFLSITVAHWTLSTTSKVHRSTHTFHSTHTHRISVDYTMQYGILSYSCSQIPAKHLKIGYPFLTTLQDTKIVYQ